MEINRESSLIKTLQTTFDLENLTVKGVLFGDV
jgi:hypothetical protein